MRTIGLAILIAALGAAAAHAQRAPRITSAYTDLDLGRCTILAQVEEGSSVTRRCPGLGGVPLFVLSGDERWDLDAGVDNEVWESPPQFSAPPRRVEWRLRAGRPFALIYRLTLSGEGERTGTVLIVETIGRTGAPGCHMLTVHGSVPNANAEARRLADSEAHLFRCGEDGADEIIYMGR